MEQSVEDLCKLLARSRLLSAEDIRTFHQRWRAEGGDKTTDSTVFTQWLVNKQILTEFQAGLLHRGKGSHFFLGQYKLLERIGKGRMAGVYKAVHPLGQMVAVKVLPPSKAKDAQLLARFQREARLAIRLKHPNVVRTFQMSEEDGLHFLVMEYLEGETLDEVLQRRGKLEPAEAVRLIHQALLGLQHIHEQGCIHRDFKPGNLMLVPLTGGQDNTLSATVKILDIGLGKALFDEGSVGGADNFQLTTAGALLGTPDYLAPEQARDASSVDIRADIYSLGSVLYHALAGQPPFPDGNLVRQLMRHATEKPRPLQEFNRAIPDGLQQIVDWMMAKDPAQRYPTPERAAQALQVFLAAASQATQPETDSKMRAYLKWLDSQGEAATVLPADCPAPVMPPVQTGTERTRPKEGSSSRPPAKTVAPPVQRPTTSARPTPSPSTGKTIDLIPEDESLDVELIAAPRSRAGSKQQVPGKPEPPAGMNRRDYFLLAFGAVFGGGIVVVLECLGYILYRLFKRKKDDDSSDGTDEP